MFLLLAFLAVFLPASALAEEYTSSSFILCDPTTTIEGGESSSASFQYISSGGQLDAGEGTSSSFTHRGGFLYFGLPPCIPASSSSPPPATSSGTGGGGLATPPPKSIVEEIIEKIFPKKCPGKGDLNSDCRVDLVDFSIAAYWYKKPLSPPFAEIEREKLSGDGEVTLRDFSIMAYWWTG